MDTEAVQKQFESHPQWAAVLHCVSVISKFGAKCYLAGGCVRDALLGRRINDFDLATDANPSDIQKLFSGSIDHGARFGMIAVPFKLPETDETFIVEITRFREDKDYVDGRRPSEIEFSSEEEDAKRRDFSINSLFYDILNKKVIDYTEGEVDLNAKVIRAVGDPQQRFKEDRLRILRAIRFQSQLGFSIEGKTLISLMLEAEHLEMISKERVYTELRKTIEGEDVLDAFNTLYLSGIFSVIFHKMNFYQQAQWTEFKIDFANIEEQSIECFLSLATIYELKRIKRGEARIEKVKELVSFYKTLKIPSKIIKEVQSLSLLFFEFGLHNLIPSIRVFESNLNSLFFKLLNCLGKKEEFQKIRKIYQNNLDSMSHLKKPLINGRDCLAIGVSPFHIGKLLDLVYEKQLLGLVVDKDEALEYIHKLKEREEVSEGAPEVKEKPNLGQ